MELEIVALFMLAVAWAALPAAGLALLAAGLRGRLIDRIPRCRRCRYLLVGFRSRPARCPECGAALLAAGRVVLGRRSPRPALSLAGAAMVLAAACPLAMVAVTRGPAAGTVAGGAPPPAAVPVQAAWTRARPRDRAPVPSPAPSSAARQPSGGPEHGPFNVHSLFGGDALAGGEAGGFAVPPPAPASGPSRRAAPPMGPAPAAPAAAAASAVPAGAAVLRMEAGPLQERRVGGDPIASRIDPRRVDERRIRPLKRG